MFILLRGRLRLLFALFGRFILLLLLRFGSIFPNFSASLIFNPSTIFCTLHQQLITLRNNLVSNLFNAGLFRVRINRN